MMTLGPAQGGTGCFFWVVLVIAGGFLVASRCRSKRRCPRCAEVNPRHARFCAHCGAVLGG